jgi:DNA-binding NarL/FixJ family response regulator
MIELLVVDDHAMFRAGLRRLLGDEPDLRVTGEAPDGATALALVRAHRFDVVLMDINMAPRNGFEVLAALRAERPRLPVVMLSMYVEAQYARHALRARANAYLSKDASPQALVAAIRAVARGGVHADASAAPGDDRAPHLRLTAREMQVLQRLVRGVPLTQIGVQMCVSTKTVGTHRARILGKFDMRSNAELVQYAVRHGLLD